ncbi:alpha/beta hydrolase [Nakamurella antarctica]|uniref:Alpha/beta hydrolase n=1 Tax=Nakamurella antarctica TaxID=1902245 RepID=A0A3G8ZKJ7_9ACTN|nr:alpha/beta fold hydrolase [Nakamurella antarctica]AZI57839.1 alpha/beta hydrolase [Nakamurella antarctica]
MSIDIRANTMLPARREAFTLTTADGVDLVAELALPLERDPVAAVICLHPLPTHGGMMDSHIFRKAAFRLPALADFAVLRFNTRGTVSEAGRSQGTFDGGDAERLDVQAAVDFATLRGLPDRWLLGWSFGTELALRYGAGLDVTGAILLSPPLHRATDSDLDTWAKSGKPLHALVPELDDYLQPDEARIRFARVPQARVTGFPGTKHLWVGKSEVALDAIVATIRPSSAPLPQTWMGEHHLATVKIVSS